MKILLMCALLTAPVYPQAPSHMEKRGQATQLIVDGKPFLALSGELANTAPSDLDYMRHIFPILANQVHLNTVLTAVAWAWIEPQEGQYDFHLVDAAIELANQNDLRIAWLWFGSWKNGQSNFAPGWVKAEPGPLSARPDPERQERGNPLDAEREQLCRRMRGRSRR